MWEGGGRQRRFPLCGFFAGRQRQHQLLRRRARRPRLRGASRRPPKLQQSNSAKRQRPNVFARKQLKQSVSVRRLLKRLRFRQLQPGQKSLPILNESSRKRLSPPLRAKRRRCKGSAPMPFGGNAKSRQIAG